MRVAEAVRTSADRLTRRVCVIASGDFAHAGPYYGSGPVGEESLSRLMQFDDRAIQLILDSKADDFYRLTIGATYCCPGPVYFLLHAIHYQTAKLLKYYTNWDVAGTSSDLNSFAAIIFR